VTDTVITDATGRRLTMRCPDRALVQQAAGLDAKGDPTSRVNKNGAWLTRAAAACAVVAIDSVPVIFPKNIGEIRDLVSKLGNPGFDAALSFVWEKIESSEIPPGITLH
jgi:hypothetical protein